MTTFSIDDVERMPNPRGLYIIHPTDAPTLSKIVDSSGKNACDTCFTSKAAAYKKLARLLKEHNEE